MFTNEEHQGELCYNGELKEEWDQHVHQLNHLHDVIYPSVLEKGTRGEWKRVHPDFPDVAGVAATELDPGYKAFEFLKKHKDKINPTKASRAEKSALDVVQTTQKYMDICVSRVKMHGLYTTLINELTELTTKEHSSSVVLLKLKYQKTKEERLEDEIMKRFTDFEELKSKVMETLKLFKDSSSCMAAEEGLTFNKRFNRNQYINYWKLDEEYRIHGATIDVYLQDQETLWTDALSSLAERPAQPQEKMVGLEAIVKTLAESLNSNKNNDLDRLKKKEVERINRKLSVFQELCKEAKASADDACLEELLSMVSEIKNSQRELKEAQFNPDIDMSDETKLYINGKSSLIKELNHRIEVFKKMKEDEESLRKNEMAANLRSMESIKLLPLTGAEDFIAWKKNQLKLNSHTDPYKKAAALLSTVKNEEDRSMLINIDDWAKMLSLLNEKYNHQEKLVPALKNKLEGLPKAQTDDQMLNNHRTTINIYEQLCAMGCKENFDGTVVYNLQQKMTTDAKKDFERFKLRRKEMEAMQQDPDYTFNVTDSFSDASLDLTTNPQDLKVVDKSPEIRRLFLLFIKEEAKLLEFTKEELKRQATEKCGKCKQIKKYCKCKKKININNVETKDGCGICGESHVNRAGKPTKSVARCPKFKEMKLDERKGHIEKSKSCFMCLTPGHQASVCRVEGKCYKCEKGRHHPLLCDKTEAESVEVHTCGMKDSKTFLKVSMVRLLYKDPKDGSKKSKCVKVMWDSGAGCNLIMNKMARELGLAGEETDLQIFTLGEHINNDAPTSPSKEFNVEIMDNQNTVHNLQCFGLDKVQSRRAPIKMSIVKDCAKRFGVPHVDISNPKGEIQMIIGISHDHLAPKLVGTDPSGLGVYSTNFGPKRYILAGTTSTKRVDINNVEANKSYWIGDQLGLNLDPKCSTCIKAPPCKQCKLLNQPVTFKEQEEGKVIRASMNFDQDNQKVSVAYPYSKDVDTVFAPEKTNKNLAGKMAVNLKKSLKKDGLLETYTDNFMDMEARGAIKELTEEEMKEWESKGNPVNYCSHHAVLKDSKSTACRSVCNSSLSHNGTSLNEMLPKGPKALSNLLHVLIRFRAKPYTVIADLKKAYNSISTSEKDCHLRRLIWLRPEDLENPDAKFRTFGMLVMAFGDTPAQYYLECAKEEISVYIREIMKDPTLADAIISMSYVDDITMSVETAEEALDWANKLPSGFESYGFKIKEIFVGGDGIEQTSKLDNQLLLGHYYNPNADELIMKFGVNFSAKKRSQKIEPNLNQNSDLTGLQMTKRKVMSLLSSQYDPLGLSSVFLAKFKIFLAKLFKIPEYDWDVTLKGEDHKKAIKLVEEMIAVAENPPTFPRSNKPEGFNLSKLVVFVDASTIALQAVVYGVYICGDKIHTSLISAKNKITNNTVPRNELQALVAGHRLALNVLEALDEPVSEVCFLSDSTCTLDSIQEGFASKDIYIINRVSEIRKSAQKMMSEVKYYHIPTEANIADKGTREECDSGYLSSKEWQHGPEFIKELETEATLALTIKRDTIPVEVNYVMIKKPIDEENILDNLMKRSNNLRSALKTLCIVKSMLRRKSFKGKRYQSKKDMQDAMMVLIKHTQKTSSVETMRTKQLVTYKEEDVVYTKMRFPEEVMSTVFGKHQLPVLPGRSDLAKLILKDAHQERIASNMNNVHNSIHQTLVNSRVGIFGCYITYAKQVIKGIIKSCTTCRRQSKTPSDAKMAERFGGFGEVPPDGSCFNKVAIDYFGPFLVKTPKFKGTRQTKPYKMHGMAVLCQQARAVKFYPVEGQDTKSFLTTFEIHCAMHGVPTHVLSDPMSAFIAGAKVVGTDEPIQDLDQDGDGSDFEEVLKEKYNIEWEFIPPGSQWRDPAERTIKSLKGMLQTIFNTEHNKPILTVNEYWSIFSQCSEILNRRPIQGYMDDGTLKFICPNQLLLGKTAKEAPPYSDEDFEIRPRLELLQGIKKEFWKCLMNILAADSRLMKYPCWYSQSREPKPGDVVLVLYKSKISDNYRMGLIESVNKNKRDIKAYVSPCQDKTLTNFKKGAFMDIPIQRTILLYSPSD